MRPRISFLGRLGFKQLEPNISGLFMLSFGILYIALMGYWTGAIAEELFIIASGDTVFIGSDFEYYNRSNGILGLSESGTQRLTDKFRTKTPGGRRHPDLMKLSGKKFQLEISGEVICEGHFISAIMSEIPRGLLMGDMAFAFGDKKFHMSFRNDKNVESRESPCDLEVFLRYFRSRGKLIIEDGER